MTGVGNVDPNDLLQAVGPAGVRDQILAALAANDPAPPADLHDTPEPPPAPSDTEAPASVEGLLARFWLVLPEDKVWDSHRKQILKKSALKSLLGRELYGEWADHPGKRRVEMDDIKAIAASTRSKGSGELSAALGRYVYLYPTNEVWDRQTREVVPVGALKVAIASCYEDWVKHPNREQIHASALVFDPTQKCVPEGGINKFRGLPLAPVEDVDRCAGIRELALHLCNGKADEFHWLMCWLAYPLQHVGAKMATAVLMHSPTEGTGKSLFFDGVIRQIYGMYGATVGQHQLESQYSDWRSCLLFALFEEVFSRDQKFNYTGTLKHMVTGKTMRVEKKFVSSWEEANHMNAVFLSNELQPWPIDDSDRRMFVVWPEKTLPPELQARVSAELENGGVEAFYGWLLNYSLWGFTPHTKPLMNREKINLIDFGRPSWEVFFRDWLAGYLDVPCMPCLTGDLFAVYRKWAERRRENVVSMHKFCAFVAKMRSIQRREDVRYNEGGGSRKGRFFVPLGDANGYPMEPGEPQEAYLGRAVVRFRTAMDTSEG